MSQLFAMAQLFLFSSWLHCHLFDNDPGAKGWSLFINLYIQMIMGMGLFPYQDNDISH